MEPVQGAGAAKNACLRTRITREVARDRPCGWRRVRSAPPTLPSERSPSPPARTRTRVCGRTRCVRAGLAGGLRTGLLHQASSGFLGRVHAMFPCWPCLTFRDISSNLPGIQNAVVVRIGPWLAGISARDRVRRWRSPSLFALIALHPWLAPATRTCERCRTARRDWSA